MANPTGRKPLGWAGLILVAGAAAATFAYSGAQTNAPRRADPGRRVLVVAVHFAPQQSSRSFVATIRPRVEADQGFRVSGKVAARLVDVGRAVTAGEALARLDATDLRLLQEQAAAEFVASRAALEQAEAEEKRGAQLREKGWTAQATYDRQRAAAGEARGRNRRSQRALELATNALDYSTLRADSSGVITAALIEPGQVIVAGQPAIRLARGSETEAAVALPESFLPRAREGAASLALWSDPGHAYTAVLRELSPAADPATRTFAARFSLPGSDSRVALGMSAMLTISAPAAAVAARLPASALFNQGNGPALWSVGKDGSIALKPVVVARYEGSDVLVTSGVIEDERVVTLGVQKLNAGEKVHATAQLAF